MQTLQKFTGINNVLSPDNLKDGDLTVGRNIDLDLSSHAQRRAGFASASSAKHANLWETPGFTLATRGSGGDLVNVTTDTVLAAGLGHTPRVWYCDLPGGRIAYSNGTSKGIVAGDGTSVTAWGVPIPTSAGAAADGFGNLFPGDYQWAVTHVRLSDGAESGPAYSQAVVTVANGAVSLSSLPVLSGHKTNVYLTSHFGGERFFAGSTTNAVFTFTGQNKDLVRRCLTEFLQPPPNGAVLLAFWRGRLLAAVDNVLYASTSHGWALFDMRRDFKQFSATITLVHPTDGGIWVGTAKELAFLQGDAWDSLVRMVKMAGPVVLGSGAAVPGEHITTGDGRSRGDGMVCVCNNWLVAGAWDGTLIPMSVGTYQVAAASEFVSTFRMVDGIPQYIAVPLS